MRVAHGSLVSLALLASACGLAHPTAPPTGKAPTLDSSLPRDTVTLADGDIETGLDALDVSVVPDAEPPPLDVATTDRTTEDTIDASMIIDARDAPPPPDLVAMDVTAPPEDTGAPDTGAPDTGPRDTGVPPSGASCEDAILIRATTGRQTIPGDTSMRASPGRYAGSCNPMSTNAPETVYRLTLDRPMQVDLQALAMSGPTFDPALYVFRESCTSMGELACSADVGDDRGPDARITRVLLPGTYFIVVDGDAAPAPSRTQTGRYTLLVDLYETDGYTVSVQTATTCPVVPSTASESLIPSQSDDGVSLPVSTSSFRFTLFNETYQAFTISTNGYVQLRGSVLEPGTTSNTADNHPMPTRDAPNEIVAAYWSDLLARNGASRIYYWFDGPSTARVAHVRWRDYSHYTNRGPIQEINLEFEIRLFYRTSNAGDGMNDAIEFQYCTVGADTGNLRRATGLFTTVGIENDNGDRGIQYAHDTANAVHTGDLIRFERR